MEALHPLLYEAVQLIYRLTTPNGILASTIAADNYKRIWARDSVVCGFAGILIKDEKIIEGLKNSLLTLAKAQHELGMIPSNVLPDNSDDVSYGSLAGRIDANTWFIIGCCMYYGETRDEATWNLLRPAVQKCRRFLNTVEFNDKGWIYTPLSGNWADEYPIHGYTLYDNMLRILGEQLWSGINGEQWADWETFKERTRTNFWPSQNSDSKHIYHKNAYKKAAASNPGHYASFILPGYYDMRFDAAGMAFALELMPPNSEQKTALQNYLNNLKTEVGSHLIPAFWPIIDKQSPDWNLLEGNYSYDFKNKPGYFHNGGIWPVWMGLFCLGLTHSGMPDEAERIIAEFTQRVSGDDSWDFHEYLNAQDFSFEGKTQMGYTASGIVFMYIALIQIQNARK
ncbi:hypothetical protein J1N09_02400 [Aureitalea sp. L0-47]|uniref:glycoside hydrolase 100 family protein n=1 Tax=Aureitalea sp. L0-47 TaxID=2816962 RepID=UPI002237E50B|nr:glycoside hydrolase 100 family protein [Aureitalea sp. L0-47]MCW5518673.1 hypothetical protein [Aureitalea sp. L0-47]